MQIYSYKPRMLKVVKLTLAVVAQVYQILFDEHPQHTCYVHKTDSG